MMIRAALLCPKPINSTKLKYCKISTTKENVKRMLEKGIVKRDESGGFRVTSERFRFY